MIATYTTELRTQYIQTFIGYNLVAFLIKAPTLGITDTPNSTELSNRRALTMLAASALELVPGNGYSRCLCTLTPITTADPTRTIFSTQATFKANGGPFPQATHIAYARGVSLSGASISNGNNAGNGTGTLIKVEPILNAPLVLASGVTLTHTTQFEIFTQAT